MSSWALGLRVEGFGLSALAVLYFWGLGFVGFRAYVQG